MSSYERNILEWDVKQQTTNKYSGMGRQTTDNKQIFSNGTSNNRQQTNILKIITRLIPVKQIHISYSTHYEKYL